jgi:phage shock protein A
MGLWSRFTQLFKAKANRMLDRAEDPGETLDYSYQRQLELLQRVKRGVAEVVTAKKRLQLQTERLEQGVVRLDSQARQALAGGRDDLARMALERKVLIQGQLQDLDQQIGQLDAQQQTLVNQERALSAKVDAFRTQKEVIKAQYSAAEAQVRIGEATTGLSGELGDVGMAVQRAHDKTEQMKARAAAVEELVATGALDDLSAPGSTELDRQLAAMSADAQIESEMAKLRAEVGAPGAAPELTEGVAEEPASPESAEREAEPSRSPEDPGRL